MNVVYNENEKALILLSLFDLSLQKEKEVLSLFEFPKDLVEKFEEYESQINAIFVKGMKTESQEKDFGYKRHKIVSQIKQAILQDRISQFIDDLNKKNIRVVTPYSDLYPKKLFDLEMPPFTLFCIGDVSLFETDSIGIVGTRTPTPYGRIITEKFAKGLSENGFTIVSGLASGVDTISHKTTLDNGGKTISVLGGGFEHIFPTFNTNLARQIAHEGLLVSEYRPDFKPALYTFPQRNRIIAGLSLGILITEAGEKSGSLHTKEFALDLGREIFVVPGNITSPMSKGTNRLIRSAQGACVLDYEDIVCVFNKKVVKSVSVLPKQLTFDETAVVKELETGEKSFEELIELTKMETKNLNPLLTLLEIKGVIKQLPGNRYMVI